MTVVLALMCAAVDRSTVGRVARNTGFGKVGDSVVGSLTNAANIIRLGEYGVGRSNSLRIVDKVVLNLKSKRVDVLETAFNKVPAKG